MSPPAPRLTAVLGAGRSAITGHISPVQPLGLVRRVTCRVVQAVTADSRPIDLTASLTCRGRQGLAKQAPIHAVDCLAMDVAQAALREFVAVVTLARLLTERAACEAHLCQVLTRKCCACGASEWQANIRSVTAPEAFEADCEAKQLQALRECAARYKHPTAQELPETGSATTR
jgi:hypothetical protein